MKNFYNKYSKLIEEEIDMFYKRYKEVLKPYLEKEDIKQDIYLRCFEYIDKYKDIFTEKEVESIIECIKKESLLCCKEDKKFNDSFEIFK